jgi:cytoskeleton protein RodZ
VQRFKVESAGDENVKPVELVFPEAADEPRMLPSGSILIWAMLIAMVIYVITYVTMPDRRSATTAKADQPAVLIEDPKDVKPTTESSVQDTWRPVAVPAPSTDEATVAYVAGGVVLPATQEGDSARLLTDDPALPPEMLFAVAQVTDVADESPATQTSTPAAAPRIVLKALEQTYIQIKDPQRGPRGVLVSRVLEAGESYQAPDRAGLIMQTGNAGGLQVEVDGRVVGVLGKSGEVITRIPLDPSYFLERIAASQ